MTVPADAVDIACDAESKVCCYYHFDMLGIRTFPASQFTVASRVEDEQYSGHARDMSPRAALNVCTSPNRAETSEKVCEKRNKEFGGSEWPCQAS